MISFFAASGINPVDLLQVFPCDRGAIDAIDPFPSIFFRSSRFTL